MINLTDLTDHVERRLCLEVKKHPEQEGGFVETRISVQCWMLWSDIIKDVKVLKIKIESLFGDKNSWVRIVKGINKFVTETSEEILVASVGGKSTGKLVAKARPRQTSNLTLSLVSIPHRERQWIWRCRN